MIITGKEQVLIHLPTADGVCGKGVIMKKKTIFCFMLIFFATFSAYSQQNISSPQKFALVIGNGNYTSITKLNNPVNDASDIKTTLESLGWTVDILRDANQEQIDVAVIKLKNRLSASASSYGFVFYAGHAVQANGINYLIPVDANYQSESNLKSRAVSVQSLLDDLDNAGNELNVVVLDACRDNPFGWSRGGSRGLVVVEDQPANSIIAFATSAGSVAADGDGRNGLYTTHLLNNLKTSGISVQELFRKTGEDVEKASGRRQRPAIYSSFNGVAYLGSQPQPNPNPNPNPNPIVSFYDQLLNARGTVTFTVTQDEVFPSPVSISNASIITIRGGTSGKTIHGKDYLAIEKGVTIILENITIRGISVLVNKGGTLVMNNASAVTACDSIGIVVEGTFTMNEGNVTNNSDGGVVVYGGNFTMNNGKIANNNYGGVSMYGGNFTMKNGSIENNSREYGGGGVSVMANGNFIMQGGSISRNRASYGGGVYVANNSIFRMTGGIIYGSNGGANANKYDDSSNPVAKSSAVAVSKGSEDKTIYSYGGQ
jgi:hypothetical protein